MKERIKNVYVWQNGMVMVFDYKGQQMTDYQGTLDEVREKIERDADNDTVFRSGVWKRALIEKEVA